MLLSIQRLLNRFPLSKQLIKFSVVGSMSAVINFIVLVLLTESAHVWYVLSAAIGFVVSAIFNFFINKRWTFRHPAAGRAAAAQAVKFSIVVSIGLCLNTGLIYILTESIISDYRVSWLGATAAVTAWNFSVNRWWTFRHRPAVD